MSLLPEPNEAARARILSALDLSENRLKEDISKVRQWLSKQPHLPQDISDDTLKSFVVGTKGLEIAKERLDRYFSVRNVYPIAFSDRDPLKFGNPEAVQQFLLPCLTKEGHSVYVIRARPGSTAAEFDHISVVKRQLLTSDYIISKGFISTGIVGVYDIGAATAAFLTRFNVAYNQIALKCYQDNYPVRIKKVILLNIPSFAVKTFETLIRPMMKPNLAKKIVIIPPGDKKTLLDHLPEEAVPKDLGGTGPLCDEMNEKFLNLLLEKRDWCIGTAKQKSDESKRIGKNKFDFGQTHGVEGTFRTLSLD